MNPLLAFDDGSDAPRQALLDYAAGLPKEQPRPALLDLLGQTWPARMVKGAIDAAKLPGDVYAGRVDPLSDEGIARANDLAGLAMTGGVGGVAREGGEAVLGAGPIRARAAADLPMDEASRLARQQEMTFRPQNAWYHGTSSDVPAFDPAMMGRATGSPVEGFSFTNAPALASDFAEHAAARQGGGAPQVIPARLRFEKPVAADLNGSSLDPREIAATLQQAIEDGHDALILRNVKMGVEGKAHHVSDVAIVIRPDQIRSIFAKFDPKNASSGDLLASLAGAGLLIGGGAQMSGGNGGD